MRIRKSEMKAFAALMLMAMVFMLLPPGQAVASSGGVGEIPIGDDFEVIREEENGMDPKTKPDSLEPGQIWVGKEVFEDQDVEWGFTITLSAWGSTYSVDDGGEEVFPLDEEDLYIYVNDIIGDGFILEGLTEDGALNDELIANGLSYDEDSRTVTWKASGEDILGEEPYSVSFTVSLDEGWEMDEWYNTNEGATVRFAPAEGNPYYGEYVDEEIEYLTINNINWNNGNGTEHGLNEITLTDYDLGLVMHMKSNNNDDFNVVKKDDGTPIKSFEFDQDRSDYEYTAQFDDGNKLLLPSIVDDATDGTWGAFWNKDGGENKTYYIWFMGLEDTGKFTVYDVSPGNNGGNDQEGWALTRMEKLYVRNEDAEIIAWDGEYVAESLTNYGKIKVVEKEKEKDETGNGPINNGSDNSGNNARPRPDSDYDSGSSDNYGDTGTGTTPTPVTTFPEQQTPLASMPDAAPPTQVEYVIIEEDDVPLGNLPKTGTAATGMMGGLGMIGAGAAGLIGMLTSRKKKA